MAADVRLRVENLSKTFDSACVLKDAAISVNAGEIHALLGANGSGKLDAREANNGRLHSRSWRRH